MERVIGIGGVFLKARDAVALRAWYKAHLGLDVQDWGGAQLPWTTAAGPVPGGATVWSLFPESSTYFDPSPARAMVNYIVRDLDAVLAALRTEGCAVDTRVEQSEFGRFGWVMDPEGNRLELWQPPPAP